MTMTTTAKGEITYLLVEDNDDHANIVERCFKAGKLSSKVHRVKSGADCLNYLSGEKPFADRARYPYPNVVLLDIRMPGVLDGLRTLRAVRADSRHSALPVTILTSSDRDQDVSRAYKMGANGYIVKSDNTREMIEKLKRLHESFETLVQLPEQKQTPATDSSQGSKRTLPMPDDANSLLQADQDAAFRLLVSAYQEDREETLGLLKVMEQVNTARFASLVHRFCVEERHLFAGSQEVDWPFIQEVVMGKLPRHATLSDMAGVVSGIAAVLEGNQAARSDNSAWQFWQGFCRAYLNQAADSPTEPDEATEEAPPRPKDSRNVAIAALAVLFVLLLAIIVRELV